MNCRFCGNFVPEGNDSCPVCGRRPEEEPIGKLLSENMPNPVAAEEKREESTRRRRAGAGDTSGQKPVSLGGHIAAVAVAVLGWLYGLSQNIIETFKTIFNTALGNTTQLASDSDFAAGGTAAATDNMAMLIIAGVLVILTIVGLIGLVRLIKGIINNAKYEK